MPREYEGYRDVLEQLLIFTGGAHHMSARAVARFDGCKVETAQKRYGIGADGIDVALLARKKCQAAQ